MDGHVGSDGATGDMGVIPPSRHNAPPPSASVKYVKLKRTQLTYIYVSPPQLFLCPPPLPPHFRNPWPPAHMASLLDSTVSCQPVSLLDPIHVPWGLTPPPNRVPPMPSALGYKLRLKAAIHNRPGYIWESLLAKTRPLCVDLFTPRCPRSGC